MQRLSRRLCGNFDDAVITGTKLVWRACGLRNVAPASLEVDNAMHSRVPEQ